MGGGITVPVYDVRIIASPPYEVVAGGAREATCDYVVAARLSEHIELFHRRYVARGSELNPPGGWRVVPSMEKAQQFAARVRSAGAVNLNFWIPLPHEPAGLRALWSSLRVATA